MTSTKTPAIVRSGSIAIGKRCMPYIDKKLNGATPARINTLARLSIDISKGRNTIRNKDNAVAKSAARDGEDFPGTTDLFSLVRDFSLMV